MANYITKNNTILLRCNNSGMRLFYDKILTTAKEEDLENNSEIMEFISLLDQNVYGFGAVDVELSEVIHSNSNIKLLQNLAKKAIDKIRQEKECTPATLEQFEIFKSKFCLAADN